MGLTRVKIAGQIRSELGVTQTELPNELLYSYLNLTQKEVVQMLGPVVSSIFRERIALGSTGSLSAINSGAGTYTDTTKVITGFTALTVNAHKDKEVVFDGTFTAVELGYGDIIYQNDATTITVSGNSRVGDDGTAVTAIILDDPSITDANVRTYALPSACMTPLYLADSTTMSSENKISIIQVDDTEKFMQNDYWDDECVAAVQIGAVMRLLKGSSASFPGTLVLTYVKRPVDYANDTDEAYMSEYRLPEEYFGILRAGMLKLAAQHLKRKDDMDSAGKDMASRIASIQKSWGLGQQVTLQEDVTR